MIRKRQIRLKNYITKEYHWFARVYNDSCSNVCDLKDTDVCKFYKRACTGLNIRDREKIGIERKPTYRYIPSHAPEETNDEK